MEAGKQPSAPQGMDIFDLWDVLWDGKWLIISSGVILTVLSIAYALLATPVYTARVVMVPAESTSSAGGLGALASQFGGLASLAGIDLGGNGGSTDTAIEMMKSFAFTASFVEEQGIRQVLFASKWDAEAGEWKGSGRSSVPTLQDAVRIFDGEVRQISRDKASGATTLSMSWKNRDLAAQWANAMVVKLNRTMREHDVAEAERAIQYLEQRIAETSNVDMRKTLYRLIETQMQTVTLASVRDEYVFRVVDPAYAPEMRSKPKRSLVVILGGMLGGTVGLLLVFGRQLLRNYRARPAA